MTMLETLRGEIVPAHRPWPRILVREDVWNAAAEGLAEARWILSGLWGDDGMVHMALRQGPALTVLSLPCPDGHFPSVGRLHPPAIRLERACCDLFGLVAMGAPDARPWLDHGRWGISHPL